MSLNDQEFESKFFGEEAIFKQILETPRVGGFERAETHQPQIADQYFDTNNLELTIRGAIYRHRVIDGRNEGTFKEPLRYGMDGSIHRCSQIEEPISPEDVLRFLSHELRNRPYLALQQFLSQKKILGALESLFFNDNDRTALVYSSGDTVVEVALDRLMLRRGKQRREGHMIEAEFKDGDYEAFRRFNDDLRDAFRLSPCPLNKVQYGASLFRLRWFR